MIFFAAEAATSAQAQSVADFYRGKTTTGSAMLYLMRMISLILAVALCEAASAQTTSPTESYPVRPVKLIVPYSAGGVADVLGRMWAQGMSKSFGQNFYVENQAGGASNIGTGVAAQQAPDGYALLLGTTALATNPSLYNKIPYDPHRDFAPITVLAATPNIVVVHPSFPAKTLKDFISVVRANPGKYNYATSGVATGNHVQAEVLKIALKLEMTAVPFNGGNPAIQSTLAGHTEIAFVTLSPGIQALVAEGKLRALGVTGTRRIPVWPDVPTMDEAGVRGQDAGMFVGVLAPAKTPPAIIRKLFEESATFLASPDTNEALEKLGFAAGGHTPEEFDAFLKKELSYWAQMIREAKIEKQ
jgi:tripartite-type tricarboxylate transporter receptor subunit TctC